MDEQAYKQYEKESSNWLRRGRLSLLDRLLDDLDLAATDAHLLEVGAGVGQNLPTLLRYGAVDAAEIDDLGLSRLRELDFLGRLYDQPIPFPLERQYDVIAALDVIEHLEDDSAAVSWLAEGLNPGGHLVASVPAYQWLFSDHDRALRHFRRYSKSSFVNLLSGPLEIVRAGYFNSAVFPAVAMARGVGNLRPAREDATVGPLKQSSMLPEPVDRFLAGTLATEAALFTGRGPKIPFGLSIFAVAKRPS